MPRTVLRSDSSPVRWLRRVGGLTLCAAVLVLPALAADEPAKEAKEAKTATPWKSLFDGKSLKGWEETMFGSGGPIEVDDGKIILGIGEGCTGVTIKQDFPKVDYEVSVDAMRVDGFDFFCGMTFPVADKPCSFIVGGWGGTVVGLSSIDGEDAANNETSSGMKFERNRWYHIKTRVTKDRITCWIDEKKVVDLSIVGRRISIRPEVEASRPFGICSWNTKAALKNIQVRPLAKEEIPTEK